MQQVWVTKIQERVLNLRRRAAKHEKRKLLEEGVVVPKGKAGRKKMKQEEREELPMLPEGETEKTLEAHRNQLVQMFNEGSKDLTKVKVLMENTFPKRRKDVVVNHTRVWKLVKDYPYLKHSSEVSSLKFILLIDVV